MRVAETFTFGDLVDRGILHVTDGYRAKNSELGGDGLIFLRAGHVTDSHIDFSGVDRFRDELTPRLEDKLSNPGDVVVTTKGNSTGRIAFVTSEMPPFVYSPHLSRWRSLKRDELEPGFLRFWSSSAQFTDQLRSLSESTDMAPYLSLRDQRRLKLSLPPIGTQRAIADVLGALDDKIEQNRRTAQSLERLARAIFQAWFVDFEPVKAKADGATSFPSMPHAVFDSLPTRFAESDSRRVPETWKETLYVVSDLEKKGWLQVGDGYRAKRSEMSKIGIPFIRAGDVNGKVKTCGVEMIGERAASKAGAKRSQNWDTVFTSKGTVGRLALVTPSIGPVVYSPQVCFWRSLSAQIIDPFFLHFWLCSNHFTNQWMAVKGETDMADFVSLADQRSMRMCLATSQVQAAFSSIARPLAEVRAELDFESNSLVKMRDYLLPKLLSGHIRVDF